MEQVLYIASKNKNKIREISEILSLEHLAFKSCDEFGKISVIEDGDTFAANAKKKLHAYLGFTDSWILADDSGLEVPALGNEPGVHSARYSKAHDDKANNTKLLKELSGIEENGKRLARFVCFAALGHNGSEVFSVRGTVEGFIIKSPRGENGFGYDPLFFYPELEKTFAEITDKEKNKISHRANAMREVRKFLLTKLCDNVQTEEKEIF